jgi:hypothetical protein
MSPFTPDPEIKGLERALKRLQPTGTVERDEIMYYAGQAAAPRPSWFWPGATVFMTCMAALLGARLLWLSAQPVVVEKPATVIPVQPDPANPPKDDHQAAPAVVDPPAEEPVNETPAHHVTESYQMQKQATRWGVDGLPAPTTVSGKPGQPQTLRSWMNALDKVPSGK